MVNYKGASSKAKLQISCPDSKKYQYSLNGGEEFFPLSGGDGSYNVVVLENISGTSYAVVMEQSINAKLENEFLPYLYSNQYIKFNSNSIAVKKGKELAAETHSDLEVINNVYEYVIGELEYDFEKAKNVKSGYLPNVDKLLSERRGICFDYTAIMVAMLRSQRIPTMLQVGWSGEVYHAWINVYVEGEGWINKYIYFDGKKWNRMDPTFADSNDESKAIMKYIEDDNNYEELYRY